jgi:hypothetical protein
VSAFEQRAYGFKVKYIGDGCYELILKAVSGKIIKISMVNDSPKAKIKINGKEAYLSRVYVFAKGSFIPKVLYYKLIGWDIHNGARLEEKITVK